MVKKSIIFVWYTRRGSTGLTGTGTGKPSSRENPPVPLPVIPLPAYPLGIPRVHH